MTELERLQLVLSKLTRDVPSIKKQRTFQGQEMAAKILASEIVRILENR